MRISDFRNLVMSMPIPYQAFTSKRSIWAPYMQDASVGGHALRTIFGPSETVCLSRSDLRRLANKSDLAEFVMATIIWGYPNGMRGKHVANAIPHVETLAKLLCAARDQPLMDWNSHFATVKPIKGIGLSTYTKFLCFLSVRIQGRTALILDNRIALVANRGVFDELASLRPLKYENAPKFYPAYLECIHGLAESLAVSAEAIEFFLFEFGLTLKSSTDTFGN